MKTRLYPMVQFKKDTWEIDEFECASVFVLVGKEKAMVIDAGIGIGDLIGAIRMTITDKPLVMWRRTATATIPAAWAILTNTT